MVRKRAKATPLWWSVVGYTGLVFLGVEQNFLGLSSNRETFQHRLFNVVVQGSLHPTSGRDKITVLMLSDAALARIIDRLRAQGEIVSWPLPAWVHASILDGLADLPTQPRAVFLDWLFLDERPGDDVTSLATAIARLNHEGTPVFVGASGAGRAPTTRADLLRALEEQNADKVFFVPVPLTTSAGVLLRYESAVRDTAGVVRPTAAFRIYNDVFKPVEPSAPAMQLAYGTELNATNDTWMRSDAEVPACKRTGGLLHRIGVAFWSIDSLQLDCPYIDEVPADQLLFGLWPPFVERLGRDRVVLYGGSLEGVADFYETPTHGREPGVRIHAAAIDNLVSYGPERYKRDDLRLWGWTVPKWLRDLLVIMMFVASIVSLRRWTYRNDDGDGGSVAVSFAWSVGTYVVVVVAFLVVASGLYAWFDLGVSGWIGLFQLAGVAALLRQLSVAESAYAYGKLVAKFLRDPARSKGELAS